MSESEIIANIAGETEYSEEEIRDKIDKEVENMNVGVDGSRKWAINNVKNELLNPIAPWEREEELSQEDRMKRIGESRYEKAREYQPEEPPAPIDAVWQKAQWLFDDVLFMVSSKSGDYYNVILPKSFGPETSHWKWVRITYNERVNVEARNYPIVVDGTIEEEPWNDEEDN
jgi:hypothetical protein